MTPDALAARLLRTFLEELDEQLRRLDADLLALEESPADAERLASVFRIFHTLKGSARVVGAPLIERVSHALEARLAAARDGGQGLDASHFALLFRAVDALRDAAQRLESRSSMNGTPLEELAREFEAGPPAGAGVGTRVVAPPGAGIPTPPPAAPPPASRATAPTPPERRHASGTATAASGGAATTPDGAGTSDDLHVRAETHVRVASEKLDDVLAAAGALQVVAGRATEVPEQLEALREMASELRRDWARRSTAMRREAQRGGGNVAADLRVLDAAADALATLTRDVARVAAVATRQAGALTRASAQVGEQARRLRLRPFAEACEALPRIVHDLQADTGTEVHLTIEGGDVQADRAVLDGMREAVLHLVRNAVDHGLEPPAERRAAGKPEAGELRVSAALHGEQLTVTVSDDGRGLDTNAIRGQLQRRGQPVPDTDAELALAVFEAGFSTRASATEISGRGVGLDVVRSIMTRLRGDVRVQWTRGRGTTFRLESPITLATQRVLFVDAGGQTLAIPTAAIARLHRVEVATLPRIDGRPALPTHAAAPMPLVSLAALLGPPLVVRPTEELALVVSIEVGERRLALAVDAFGDEEEIVVRPIEHRGARPLPQLAGAAMLADGRIALVLNPAALASPSLARGRRAASVEAAAPAARARPRILVVDDSITTRTLEESVLTGAGFDVLTAVDGADGWKLLQEHGADLVLTDIEMPRMDGVALCEAVRASRRFAQLPVVLVTSLESAADRARGLDAGADAYIVKSGFDQEELLTLVRQLLGRGEGGA